MTAARTAERAQADRAEADAARTPDHVHDLVGIGIGPFGLGLAALTDPLDDLDAVFVDAADGFRWQPSHVDDETADRLVPLVRRVLFESGRAVVAKTVVDGRPCLKLTLLDPESRLADVTGVLDLIRASSAALLESDDLAATAPTTEGSAR